MANSNAKSVAAVSIDTQIHIGKAKYTMTQALEHGAAVYDKLYLLQSSTLDCYNELGLILLQTKSLYKSDKLFGQFLGKSPLGCMSRQDRTDAMFIAANWNKVQKLNDSGALDSLGVSAIRKRIKKADQPKAPVSAGNVSEGKAKAEPKVEATDGPSVTKTEAKPVTADDLATFVKAQMKEHGITQAAFNKAMKA
jgi:hypothetical protein